MGIAEETADRLAADVIAHIEATGDEDVITLISKGLGDSSQTLQELFITSVRVQRAAIRANRMLAERAEELERRASMPQPEQEPEPEPVIEPEAPEAEPETAPEPEEAAASLPTEEPQPNRAAQRAREALERRKAERDAAEEAVRKAEADVAARRGRRAVPEVKTDPRLG